MHLESKKVLVIGAGKSGISATRLLQKQGAYVILYDANDNINISNFQNEFNIEEKFELVIGTFPNEIAKTLDLAIISPGVPMDNQVVRLLRSLNIPIMGEIELAYRLSKGRVIAITGTNGKTTTTILTGEILRTYFGEVFVVGNIGEPYTDVAGFTREQSLIVAELSSFQLETIDQFKADVSAILNISPDHLDRHKDMETYIKLKERVTKNQEGSDLCILNYEDPILRSMADRLEVNVIFFSSRRILNKGLFLDGDEIILLKDRKRQLVCNTNDLHIIGRHNYENLMVAVAIGIYLGVPMDHIRKIITSFKGVEHRIEYVANVNGVTYYNDSKGTNPQASIKAIQTMEGPTILIAGGYDKGNDFDQWIKSFKGKVKSLVLIGETRFKIEEAARRQGFTNVFIADTLEEAVDISRKQGDNGDVVLLSPACASWGMFANYEERGRLFKTYVNNLN